MATREGISIWARPRFFYHKRVIAFLPSLYHDDYQVQPTTTGDQRATFFIEVGFFQYNYSKVLMFSFGES